MVLTHATNFTVNIQIPELTKHPIIFNVFIQALPNAVEANIEFLFMTDRLVEKLSAVH